MNGAQILWQEATARTAFRKVIWLFPIAFAFHVVEEGFGFTAWVNRYASPNYTQADFLKINAEGMVMGLIFTLLASLFPNRITIFLFFVSCLLQAFFNLFFHAGATIYFQAYCPGVFTSVLLYPPLTFLLTHLALREGWLSKRSAGFAYALAALIHFIVVRETVFRM